MFSCSVCGFKGKDTFDLNRHNETEKHKLNLGMKLDIQELKDIRLMDDDERKKYIHSHRYFREEYSPQLADFFKKQDRFRYIIKVLHENPSKLTPKQMERRIKEIKDQYPDDYEGNEIIERLDRLQYANDIDNLDELIAEKDRFMIYFTGMGMNVASPKALAQAEMAVKKRMILELESFEKAKLLLEEKTAKEMAKTTKQKAELELKIKLLELKTLGVC